MKPLIDVDSVPQVAVAFQNEDHLEEVRLLNAAAATVHAVMEEARPRSAAIGAMDALVRHTREHFDREEAAMQRTGFPSYPVHRAEHQRMLRELVAMENAFGAGGDPATLHRFLVMDVPQWFLAHLRTIDLVTGNWIASHGG